MPIFEYHSPMHKAKPEFYYYRHTDTVIVKTFGGEAEGFGGEASPLHPPVDETLSTTTHNICLYGSGWLKYFIQS